MTQPASAFPEYRDEGLTRDSREHLLGALDYGKQAHDDLLRGDRRSALIKIDYLVALAREARKPLLGSGQNMASTPPAGTDQATLL